MAGKLEAQLDKLITKHGLADKRERIQKSMKRSVELRLIKSEMTAKVGASRLGGYPDLPSAEAWPHLGRTPLVFLGQIRFEDLQKLPGSDELPCNGLVSFFYDEDTDEPGHWRVLYFESDDGLSEIKPTRGPAPRILPMRGVKFVPAITIPSFRSVEIEPLDLDAEDLDRYWDLREQLSLTTTTDANAPLHRILGHPDGLQGCMQRIVQFHSRGLKLPKSYDSPRAKELIRGARDWRLLFQLDSDEDLDVSWGDAGRLYFWIHRDALAKREFDKTWMFMQCH